MLPRPQKICLVVPCYNEAKRIDIAQFHSALDRICFLFVNDGSTDGTLAFLEASRKEGMYILDIERNSGKAEAVRRGMLHMKSMPVVYDMIDWIGFIDADLSMPIAEIYNFLRYNETFGYRADAIWGSRIKKLGSVICRSPWRHLFGRAFATLVGFCLQTEFYDSQCGAKLFKKELVDVLFQEPFISRWIFDIEIYMRMKGHRIVEYPLQEWLDVRGGKVNILKMLPRVLFDILRIKLIYSSRWRRTATK